MLSYNGFRVKIDTQPIAKYRNTEILENFSKKNASIITPPIAKTQIAIQKINPCWPPIPIKQNGV